MLDNEIECAYCGASELPSEPVPGADNNAAWRKIAADHLPGCEWVDTRAHRLLPEHGAYGWSVVDLAGGRWWPGEDAIAVIEQALDPADEVLRICREEPMRGEWAC